MALSPYTWEQLARATLRRQFPAIRGRGRADVVELVRRVGPIQSQVVRSPFVAESARLPGASYGDINTGDAGQGPVGHDCDIARLEADGRCSPVVSGEGLWSGDRPSNRGAP